jgi:superfamily II DNA/RNA helicase
MDNNIVVEDLGFDDLNLNEDLLKGVYLYGFTKPSKIQISGIKSINTGRDCLLQSQSGTGKTATYLLGILNRLDDNENTCNAIILTPTRELADQVYDVAIELSKFTKFKIVKCVGGTNIMENRDLIKTSNVIIGTIGRINHMIKEKRFNIHTIKLLVIDEADELFTDGINENLQFIFDKCPPNIQCCMISATMSQNVFNISKKLMHDPIKVLLKNSEVAVELIKQYYIDVETEELKFDTLLDLYAMISTYQTIIFCNTIRKVDWLKENLEKNNFVITCMHGKMNQKERDDVIKEFRKGNSRILLTSDLLSRGVDIPSVSLVINYDLCPSKETYIHRIGRTSRVNNIGVAISMVKMHDPADVKTFNIMKNHFRLNIKELPENIDQLFK